MVTDVGALVLKIFSCVMNISYQKGKKKEKGTIQYS